MKKDEKPIIIIPKVGEFEFDYIYEKSNELRNYTWTFKKWEFRPALIDKNGNSREFIGQKFDSDKFELIEKGWNHDHCEICFITITENEFEDEYVNEAYNYGSDWICKSCYENLIEPSDLNKAMNDLKK